MSNASLFRRASYAETLMMNACMPKAAANVEPKPVVERRPSTLTYTIADAAKAVRQ